jgi:hypothetical protein
MSVQRRLKTIPTRSYGHYTKTLKFQKYLYKDEVQNIVGHFFKHFLQDRNQQSLLLQKIPQFRTAFLLLSRIFSWIPNFFMMILEHPENILDHVFS